MDGANATIASSFQRLSSFSTSALLEGTRRDPFVPGSTVFNAPVRTSLTSNQATALAGFHQQPKPSALNSNTTRRNPHQLITASPDNLGIREQMVSERRRRRLPVRYSASLNSSSSSSSGASSPGAELSVSGAADVSGNSTESWHLSTRQDSNPNPIPGSSNSTNAATYTIQSQKGRSWNGAGDEQDRPAKDAGRLPLQCRANSPEIPKALHCTAESSEKDNRDLRGSFTISKGHTLYSANAAGLPIIKPALERDHLHTTLVSDSKDGIGGKQSSCRPGKAGSVSSGPVSSGLGGVSHSQEVEQKRPHSRSSSSSSSGSAAGGVRVLRLFHPVPKPEESPDHDSSSRLPPEILQVRERMREREREIRREQARLEEQLTLERNRFHQQVFEVLTQERGSRVEGPSKVLPRGGSVDHLDGQAQQPLASVLQSEGSFKEYEGKSYKACDGKPCDGDSSKACDGELYEACDEQVGFLGEEPHHKVPALTKVSVEESHSDSKLESGTEEPIHALSMVLDPPVAVASATSQQTPLKTGPQAIHGLERINDKTVTTTPVSTAKKPGSPPPNIPTTSQYSTGGSLPGTGARVTPPTLSSTHLGPQARGALVRLCSRTPGLWMTVLASKNTWRDKRR